MYRSAWAWLLLALAVAVAGFWPSFFANPGRLSASYLLHGVLATGWLVLLVVQARLYRDRRYALHRTLGTTSFVVAPLLVLSGFWIVGLMLAKDPDPFPPGVRVQLAFLDVVSMALFTFLYVQAIRHRRNLALHARYLCATALVMLPPALTRLVFGLALGAGLWPELRTFDAPLFISFLAVEIVLLALLLQDWREPARRAPYAITLAVIVATHVANVYVPHTPAWQWTTARMAALAG